MEDLEHLHPCLYNKKKVQYFSQQRPKFSNIKHCKDVQKFIIVTTMM